MLVIPHGVPLGVRCARTYAPCILLIPDAPIAKVVPANVRHICTVQSINSVRPASATCVRSSARVALPLFVHQQHLDVLADGMDRIDARYGQHTIYFSGMWGAEETAPTRISFTQIPAMEELE